MTLAFALLALVLLFAGSIASFSAALLALAVYALNGFSMSLSLFTLCAAFVFVPVAVGALVDRVCFAAHRAQVGALVGAVCGLSLLFHSPLILEAMTTLGAERPPVETLALNAGIIAVAVECVVQVSVPLMLLLILAELPLVWLGRVRGLALGSFAASLRPLMLVLALSVSGRLISEHILASFNATRLLQ
ncbi:MAG: hypothetical protein QY326_00525 [Bdellovibrionota bacterium]|nr:MAG: hypothetical protein QY326_00525 [Bdellovibrionota bacterium]